MDTNKDGTLTFEELTEGFTTLQDKLGFSLEGDKITEVVKSLDQNGNGTIDYTEFIAAVIGSN